MVMTCIGNALFSRLLKIVVIPCVTRNIDDHVQSILPERSYTVLYKMTKNCDFQNLNVFITTQE